MFDYRINDVFVFSDYLLRGSPDLLFLKILSSGSGYVVVRLVSSGICGARLLFRCTLYSMSHLHQSWVCSSVRIQFGMVLLLSVDGYCKFSVLASLPIIPIRSIGAACQRRRIPLCVRLVFHILGDCNRFIPCTWFFQMAIHFVTKRLGASLEHRTYSVVLRLPDSEKGNFPYLLVIAMFPVVVGSVPLCTESCWYYNSSVCRKGKWAVALIRPSFVDDCWYKISAVWRLSHYFALRTRWSADDMRSLSDVWLSSIHTWKRRISYKLRAVVG